MEIYKIVFSLLFLLLSCQPNDESQNISGPLVKGYIEPLTTELPEVIPYNEEAHKTNWECISNNNKIIIDFSDYFQVHEDGEYNYSWDSLPFLNPIKWLRSTPDSLINFGQSGISKSDFQFLQKLLPEKFNTNWETGDYLKKESDIISKYDQQNIQYNSNIASIIPLYRWDDKFIGERINPVITFSEWVSQTKREREMVCRLDTIFSPIIFEVSPDSEFVNAKLWVKTIIPLDGTGGQATWQNDLWLIQYNKLNLATKIAVLSYQNWGHYDVGMHLGLFFLEYNKIDSIPSNIISHQWNRQIDLFPGAQIALKYKKQIWNCP